MASDNTRTRVEHTVPCPGIAHLPLLERDKDAICAMSHTSALRGCTRVTFASLTYLHSLCTLAWITNNSYGPCKSMRLQSLRSLGRSHGLALVCRLVQTLFMVAMIGQAQAASLLPGHELQGKAAPDFALRSMTQQNLRLSEFRGEVVLINFWASWCGACRQAMPGLNGIYDKYHRAGLVMLSISLDDESHRAEHMAQSLKIAFPVLLDERKAVGKQYQVDNMPMTLMIDRTGTIRHVHVGYNLGDERKYLAEVRALLDE